MCCALAGVSPDNCISCAHLWSRPATRQKALTCVCSDILSVAARALQIEAQPAAFHGILLNASVKEYSFVSGQGKCLNV